MSAGGVRRPNLGDVRLGREVDFAYILREDTQHVVDGFVERIATRRTMADADRIHLHRLFASRYQSFMDDLSEAFLESTREFGTTEVHRFSCEAINARRLELLDPEALWLSMDPLADMEGVVHLGVSRWYEMGGIEQVADGHRPGFAPVEQQLVELLNQAEGRKVSIVEDDVFTGTTMRATTSTLRNLGFDVRQVVVGIQVAESSALAGLALDTAVRYLVEGRHEREIDAVDLGDPRDYLAGASGLVIRLDAKGEVLGRAPYLLPFVSTSARASIPPGHDKAIARSLLATAIACYSAIDAELDEPITLSECDPSFATLATVVHDVAPNVAIVEYLGTLCP